MSTEIKLKKREIALLERCWLAEVCSQLPAQIGKSKAVKRLESDGYISPMEVTIGGQLPVRVRGYQLTPAGRLVCCTTPT